MTWSQALRLLPEMVVIGAIGLARLSGAWQFLEWAALDAALRLRPPEPFDDRIVIVGIREPDIRGAGKYPIPDRALADLLTTVKAYQPAVIGLDIFRDLPVAPGHAALRQIFQTSPNLIAVEKVLPSSGFTVNAPPDIAPEQVGFADAILDEDGKLRRSLLGTLSTQGDYRLSFSIRLAAGYLQTHGITLGNGIQDPIAMRFGAIELPRVQPNSGGYIRTDAGGNQMLISFRSGRQPFRLLTLEELRRGVDPAWLRGKVVLIGYTAPSVKDVINTAAIATDNALVYGVEIQAHVVSQIISAVLDGRPLLRTWADGWEYLWIIGWGVIGLLIGRGLRRPLLSLGSLVIATVGLVGSSYGLLLLGWWVPIVPAGLALILNGAGLAAFYRYDESLRSRLQDRQVVIDQTFDAIHNGPLQTLANLLRQVQTTPTLQPLAPELQALNQELRSVYEAVRREALLPDNTLLWLEQEHPLDLQAPLHQTLYAVYQAVLERDFPGFQTLKLKVVKFEPLAVQHLSANHKRGLCRFLEEALCNVGKHAIAPTRLTVTCRQEPGGNVIRVVDNGTANLIPAAGQLSEAGGFGTQQAQKLAQQLRGRFHRLPHPPHGMMCELTWRDRPAWFSPFGQRQT